ncbi:MAG: hypothetical protein JO027_07705 [Solirubrobacterales bacterium]|nr:hypothetical protein [Solirubrobacterales bacterium]
MSADGRTLWLKWAANFDGCAKGLDCSGAYGFNVAEVRLTTPTPAKAVAAKTASAGAKSDKSRKILYAVTGLALPLLLLLFVLARPGFRGRLRRSVGDAQRP